MTKDISQRNDYINKLTLESKDCESKLQSLEEKMKVKDTEISKLNDQCKDLTNDALSARGEFEKELRCRIQLEKVLETQEKDFGKKTLF